MMKACEWCGKEYSRSRSKIGRYCSDVCRESAQSATVVITCHQCGQKYSTWLSRCKKSKYCSPACYAASKVRRITRSCQVCGQQFCTIASDVTRRYCSPRCTGHAKRKSVDQLTDPQYRRKKLVEIGVLKYRDWFRTEAMEGFQICTRCREEKSIHAFRIDKRYDTTSSVCSVCETRRSREWAQNPENIERRRLLGRHAEHRRRVRLKGVLCTLTEEEWQNLIVAYKGHCAYCGRLPDRLTLDHIVPVSRRGSHTVANVVPACMDCNRRKGNKVGVDPLSPMDFVNGVPVRKVDLSGPPEIPWVPNPEHDEISWLLGREAMGT